MIAVLGAAGQLGSSLVRLLGDAAVPVGRVDLDLEDLDSIGPWMDSLRPSVVVNCAAYTAVDAAESDADRARLLNAHAVERLAAAAARRGCRFVTFSTDYVFDGMKKSGYVESDEPKPLSVYGATKREGEQLARAANAEALIVRTSWVLSSTHPSFVSTILRLVQSGTVEVVDDQVGRPTIVDDLAVAVVGALESGATGLLHLAGGGVTTWFALAQEVAALAREDPGRIIPVSSDRLSRPAMRPANSVLDSERLAVHGLQSLPHYRLGLERIVANSSAAS